MHRIKLFKRLVTISAFLASGACVTTSAVDKVLDNYRHPKHGWHRGDNTIVKNPVPKSNDSIARGKSLFKNYCVVCHGESGLGNGPYADKLKPKPANLRKVAGKQTDYHIYLQVSMGQDKMPMWKSELDDKDRWDIVNYVQTLAD